MVVLRTGLAVLVALALGVGPGVRGSAAALRRRRMLGVRVGPPELPGRRLGGRSVLGGGALTRGPLGATHLLVGLLPAVLDSRELVRLLGGRDGPRRIDSPPEARVAP